MANLGLTLASLSLSLLIAELLLKWFWPQPYLYPRFAYSAELGHTCYPNTRYEHHDADTSIYYQTNALGWRGNLPEEGARKRLLLLGDSYTFGMGVNDGQEFASLLAQSLSDSVEVLNLGVPGWGLSQEIRQFYMLAEELKPAMVLICFFHNDLADNFRNKVSYVDEEGAVRFAPATFNGNMLKRFLSKSMIQKSQLYNLLRLTLYNRVKANEELRATEHYQTQAGLGFKEKQQHFYARLLDAFARDLQRRDIRLLLFSVNGWRGPVPIEQIRRYPIIMNRVKHLEEEGALQYLSSNRWFSHKDELSLSPVGHYGPKWHTAIARGLAEDLKLKPAK